MNRNYIEWARWIPAFIFAVLLITIFKTFDNISQITLAIGRFIGVISPFLYGILIVYFLFVPYKKLEELYGKAKVAFVAKKAKVLSVITVYLLLILVITFVVTFFVPILTSSVIDLANSIPAYVNILMNYFDSVPEGSILSNLNISEALGLFFNNIVRQSLNPSIIEQFTRSVINVVFSMFNIFISLVVSLFILLYLEQIASFLRSFGKSVFKKDKVRNGVSKYSNQVNKTVFTFIASKGLDCIINLISVTGILLVFNVQYAFLFGFMAGLLNFIPYLGSLIAVISISVITVLTGGLGKAIPVLIFLLIFQQMDANFIEPKIVGSSLKINPLIVIFAVVVGGAYFGIIGMFLSVPVAAIIKQILLEYISNAE